MSNTQKDDPGITRDEVKKEFQLERMILFSDAVFAIVITLMAMEIKVPEGIGGFTFENWPALAHHLIPRLLSYSISFVFIGIIWYQHLRIFSIVKDYNAGLVAINLLLLFFVGLFPFTSTIITSGEGRGLGFFVYLGIIFICVTVQYILLHYLIVRHRELVLQTDLTEWEEDLNVRKRSLIVFGIANVLIVITYVMIENPILKPLSMMWMMLFGLFSKKKKK